MLPSLSLICLAYNEEENVQWALPILKNLLNEVTSDWEIVFSCSEQSSDSTNFIIQNASQEDNRIKQVFQPKNSKGYGIAFASALKAVTKEFCFHVDIDGQFDFKELKRAVELLLKLDADLVHFNRFRRKDPFERLVIGFCFKTLVHLFYKCPVWDFDSAFNLFRSRFINQIILEGNSGMIIPEFLIKFGQLTSRIIEGKTAHLPRRAGKPIWFSQKKFALFSLPDFGIIRANLIDIWRLRKTLGSRI